MEGMRLHAHIHRHPLVKKLKHFSKKKVVREIAVGLLALFLVIGGAFFLWISSFKIPDLSSFETRKVLQSTKIYDRTGKVLLYDVHQDVKRTIIPYGDISRNIKNATIAIEDTEFYQHYGIKPTAILRAVFANILGLGYSQGGSTITQQVVKNSLLTTEKKLSRKLKEWVLALKLERVLDKESILSMYLNESPYGGNVYGVEEASQTFFGKHASEVTLAESAYLASLPNAPTYYSPYGNNRKRLEERKNLVLRKMLENKFVTDTEYKNALAEKVEFKTIEDRGIKAPHFVLYVKEYLESTYGKDAVESAGLKVITTLNYDLQKKAEEIARKFGLENKVSFNAENAAMIAIDPQTGGILTMVGSRDYFDKEIDGNFNVSVAHRQPGSSFKPFVYAEAFNKGYLPETQLFDVQTEFSTECNPDGTPIIAGNEDKCYMPVNYDGKFRGPISLRNALAQSLNIPAIKTLYLAGLHDSLRLAKDMGINSLGEADRYGLTLVLGGGEVSLLDMTSGYSVFANEGNRNPYTAILRVEDKDGNVLESFEKHPVRVLSENTSNIISSILSDDEAREPEFGRHSPLYFENRDVAVKTGTTNDYRDAWIIGYAPNIAVGAWAGNNDNSPMEKKIAGFIVAPMWHTFMEAALKTVPDQDFKEPPETALPGIKPVLRGFWEGNQTYFVEKISGARATDLTPPEFRTEKAIKNVHSILYWIDKDNPQGPAPFQPENDPQFHLWEYAVQKWVRENGIVNETDSVIPTASDPLHRPELAPVIKILNPTANTTYSKNTKMYVAFIANSVYPISRADFYINGAYAGSSNRSPFDFSFTPSDIESLAKENVLRVVAYDSFLNKSETNVPFLISDLEN
jgi:penicillin-binding protein 1C